MDILSILNERFQMHISTVKKKGLLFFITLGKADVKVDQFWLSANL